MLTKADSRAKRTHLLPTQRKTVIMPVSSAPPNSRLLDLPDEVLCLIVSSLGAADLRRLMPACRKTAWMTVREAKARLRITSSTRFNGIRKVLDLNPRSVHLEIICSERLDNCSASLAVSMLLGLAERKYTNQVARSCCWQGITKVSIQGFSLGCLLPQFLALSCPRLAQLTITKVSAPATYEALFITEPSKAQPLGLSSSLTQLKFHVCRPKPSPLTVKTKTQTELYLFRHALQALPGFDNGTTYEVCLKLPGRHHSPGELRSKLPSINTLTFKQAPSDVLIRTFATQLTRLGIESRFVPETAEKSIRECSQLQHLRIGSLILPDNTAALRVLELGFGLVMDKHIRTVLQLTSLVTVRLGSLCTETDWTGHPCSWQEFHIEHLPKFTSLAKLNLKSIKKFSTGPDVEIKLPESSNPNSLEAVQCAADNLAYVGQIVVENGDTTTGRTGARATIRWEISRAILGNNPDPNEAGAADQQLVAVAAQRIGPVKGCDLGNLFYRPTLHTVITWGHSFIESVCLGRFSYINLQETWERLQPLRTLKTVTMWPRIDYSMEGQALRRQARDQASQLLEITNAVCCASTHYVVPTRRSVRLQFGVLRPDRSIYLSSKDTANGVMTKAERDLLKDGQMSLKTVLSILLPAGSRLVSVDTVTSDQFCREYNSSGWRFCWSVLIEPC